MCFHVYSTNMIIKTSDRLPIMSHKLTTQSYNQLDPDTIINAIESVGYLSDQRILALNSYENRVYQIGIEEQNPVVAKFYRPGRWSDEMIKEEHAFTIELAENDIPVVAPVVINGQTLFKYKDYRFAVYPRFGGHAPELDNPDHLLHLGRILAQLHNTGETKAFIHRPDINIEDFAIKPAKFLTMLSL